LLKEPREDKTLEEQKPLKVTVGTKEEGPALKGSLARGGFIKSQSGS
jgi:hypothetical protein